MSASSSSSCRKVSQRSGLGAFGSYHRQAVLAEQPGLLKRAVRQMVHAVLEMDAVLFDGKGVGKGQQLDGLQNVGDFFGQAGGDIFLDVL